MILHTKAAKVVLSTMASCLTVLAVLVAVTGWDGTSSSATTQESVAQPVIAPEAVLEPEPEIAPESVQAPQVEIPSPESTAQPTPLNEVESVSVPTPSNAPESTPTPQEVDKGSIEEFTGVLVYIDPYLQEARPGEEISINVNAMSNTCGISGSEITLEFDPSILQVTGLSTDGVLGSNPLIGREERNNDDGILRYALARRGPTQITAPPEVLAIIKVKVIDSADSGLHDLTLKEVRLTDEKFEQIGDLEIKNGSIEVVP